MYRSQKICIEYLSPIYYLDVFLQFQMLLLVMILWVVNKRPPLAHSAVTLDNLSASGALPADLGKPVLMILIDIGGFFFF